MDAHKDYQDNRLAQLEDEIRELNLEIHLLVCKNANLQVENDKLSEELAGPIKQLSDDEIDNCAYTTGMWCDGTPDSWDTEAIRNFARAVIKEATNVHS